MPEIVIYLLLGGGIFIVYLNVSATYYLHKSDTYDRTQRIAQTIIIWCLPAIGAFVVMYFVSDGLRSYKSPTKIDNAFTVEVVDKTPLIERVIFSPLWIFPGSSCGNSHGSDYGEGWFGDSGDGGGDGGGEDG